MPKHFLYLMNAKTKAPAGDGDTESWFYFYKWGRGVGETYLPQPPPFFEGAAPGDFIWPAFVARGFEGRIVAVPLGAAQIMRVEQERHVQEIWYDADDIYAIDPLHQVHSSLHESGEVPEELAKSWLMRATRSHP